MDVSVSANEPSILRDARGSDLFLVHTIDLAECVCALTQVSPQDALALDLVAIDDYVVVVVIGCRVADDSPLHRHTGRLQVLHLDTPITLLQQVERLALRERSPVNESTPHGAQAPPQREPISRL